LTFFAVTSAMLTAGAVSLLNARADEPRTPSQAISAKVVKVKEPIPYKTTRKPTSELREGSSKTVQAGANGYNIASYRVTYRDGDEVSRELLGRKLGKKPIAEVIHVGTAPVSRGRLASRGYYAGRRVVTMIATGYDPSPASNGGTNRTSTGLKVGHGIVAVDPNFIPIGTRLFIEGYGYAVAADVGGAIKGNRIDLGHDTARGARNVGRRVVRVRILN